MKRLSETDQLESRLEALGNSIRRQYLLEGLIRFISFILLGIVVLFLLDYITHMPMLIRWLLMSGGLGYGSFWFVKNYYRKYQVKLSAQEVSLLVERANPSLQSRMISTLQFQEVSEVGQGTSENLVEGLVNQTFQMIYNMQFSNAIDKRWIKGTMKLFASSLMAVLIVMALGYSSFFVFFKRIVDAEAKYPTKTRITKVSFDNVDKIENLRIPEGERLTVRVTADGELPPVGKLNIQFESGGETEYDLNYDEKEKVFVGTLDPLMEKAEIAIYLGDDQWGPKSIFVIPRPKIVNMLVTVTPPKYTGRPIDKVNSGNIQAFENSVLDFEIESDKDLMSLDLIDLSENNAKTSFVSKSPKKWAGQIKAQENKKYTFQLVDKEKLNSHSIPIFTLSIERDKAPVIKISRPLPSIETSPVSSVFVSFQIVDDFTVKGYRMFVQAVGRNEQGEEILKGQPNKILEKSDINQKLVDYNGKWKVAANGAIPGDRVKIWIEAWDNHEPEALLMKSQDVYVSVISEEELRLRLMSRMGEVGKQVDELKIDVEGSERSVDSLSK